MTEPIYLSATSAGRLATCEQRYVYEKVTPDPDGGERAKSKALALGTLVHRLVAAWYQGRAWESEFQLALEEDPFWEPGFAPDTVFIEAEAIMEDWVRFYGETPDGETLLASELPFDLEVPGVAGVRVRGFLDGVLAIPTTLEDGTPDPNRSHDTLVVQETKTMGRWGRDKLVPVDPQLRLYLWAARQMFPVTEARFDAISTYPYKEPTPERRFKRITVPWSQETEDVFLDNLKRLARRAKALHRKPGDAIRNVSMDSCFVFCDHRDRCFAEQGVEVTL